MTDHRDHDVERALLASIVTHPDAMTAALEYVNVDDFDDLRNRKLYAAMLRLHYDHVPIDAVTIRDALRGAGDLDDVDAAYFASVVETPGSASHARYYARAVHGLAMQRALDRALADVAASAGTYAQRLDALHAALMRIDAKGIDEKPSFSCTLADVAQHLDDVRAAAVPTGYIELDRALAGGPKRGHLVVLAANTSRGKSTLALNIAANVARRGGAALMFSLEMTDEQLARRLLHAEAQIPHIAATTGLTAAERERIAHAVSTFAAAKLDVIDGGNLTPARVRALAQRRQREWRGLDLVVVDYLGLMRSTERTERREREIASISRDLKLLAVELDCVVLACAQLNRESQRRDDPRPRLSDLRDSGAIEQDADTVIFIDQPPVKPCEEDVVELVIAKQRDGALGVVKLRHRAEMTRFETL